MHKPFDTAERSAFRDSIARFVERAMRPFADQWDEAGAIPESLHREAGALGAFGFGIDEAYGGFASGTESDYIAMVVATEELSRGSLGAGGSLITRPEILARALEAGGTEDQERARDQLRDSPDAARKPRTERARGRRAFGLLSTSRPCCELPRHEAQRGHGPPAHIAPRPS